MRLFLGAPFFPVALRAYAIPTNEGFRRMCPCLFFSDSRRSATIGRAKKARATPSIFFLLRSKKHQKKEILKSQKHGACVEKKTAAHVAHFTGPFSVSLFFLLFFFWAIDATPKGHTKKGAHTCTALCRERKGIGKICSRTRRNLDGHWGCS